VFSFVETLQEEGYDMVEFHRGLIETLRTVLRVRLGEDGGEMGLREDLVESYRVRADAFSPGDLIRMLAQSTDLEASGSLRRSPHPRLLLEMLLLRLSYLDRTVELEELLQGLGPEDPGVSRRPSPRGSPAPNLSKPVDPERPPRGDPAPGEGLGSGGPAPKPATEDTTAGSLREAWDRLLKVPGKLPKGVSVVLKGASVDFSQEGAIKLLVPPGPGLERLSEPGIVKALKKALTEFMDSAPEILVQGENGVRETSPRITEDTVRKGRLQELVEKEPTLGEAVKELDLELLD
jgi:DNA polymerase-3 subunit gamma/tau